MEFELELFLDWMKVNGFSSCERGGTCPEASEKLNGERGDTGVESAEESGEVGSEEVGDEGELKLDKAWRQTERKLRWLFKAAFFSRTRARSSFRAKSKVIYLANKAL